MIEVENLCFAYQEGSPIFADFNWTVAQAERWSVIGPSGCGKTTLLYLLGGLCLPTSGKISVKGNPLTKPRLATGLVLQNYGLLPWATAFDNIAVGLRLRQLDKNVVKKATEEWLTKLAIAVLANRYPVELSGGQQQRVAIARTLALEPDLLLMDEPFGSLDALTREEMQNLMLSLWENLPSTMILVTHNIEEAVFLGKRIMIMGHPPNTNPVIIENNNSGYREYRDTANFVEKCKEVRGLVERSVNNSYGN